MPRRSMRPRDGPPWATGAREHWRRAAGDVYGFDARRHEQIHEGGVRVEVHDAEVEHRPTPVERVTKGA